MIGAEERSPDPGSSEFDSSELDAPEAGGSDAGGPIGQERDAAMLAASTAAPHRESQAAIASRLLRTQGKAALSTLLARGGPEPERADLPASDEANLFRPDTVGRSWPFTSLVTVALREDAATGTPLLLLSGLSEHTRNLRADPRLSLLLDDVGSFEDPLAGPRLTILGRAVPSADAEDKARFVARHPKAALYAGFADFAIWEVRWERAHLIAGFGRAGWLTRADLEEA